MPFKLTGYCRLRSKDRQEGEECKHQMESSQQRQTRLQDISAHKAIYSQLETLEKRAIIYNYSLTYSCDFHEGRQHFITLLLLVLNFAF